MSSILKFSLYILLIVALGIFFIIDKKKNSNKEEDERQKVYCGKGFKIAFYVLIICNFLSYLFCRLFEINLHTEIFYIISIVVSCGVFLIYGIWTDSVFTKRATKKTWIIIAIVFLGIIIRQIIFVIKSDAIENLIILVVFVAVYVITLINFLLKPAKLTVSFTAA